MRASVMRQTHASTCKEFSTKTGQRGMDTLNGNAAWSPECKRVHLNSSDLPKLRLDQLFIMFTHRTQNLV